MTQSTRDPQLMTDGGISGIRYSRPRGRFDKRDDQRSYPHHSRRPAEHSGCTITSRKACYAAMAVDYLHHGISTIVL